MLPYQEHGTVDGPEKHRPATIDEPLYVELHGPSDVNWADNVVHARVNKEAGNKDKGKQELEEGQGEGEAESEDVSDELNSLEGSDGEEGEQGRVRKFIHKSYHEFHPERDINPSSSRQANNHYDGDDQKLPYDKTSNFLWFASDLLRRLSGKVSTDILSTMETTLTKINGPKMWLKSNEAPMECPDFRKQRGRPKKMRNLQLDEKVEVNQLKEVNLSEGVKLMEGVKLLEGVKLSINIVNQGVGKGLGHRSRWVAASLHQDCIAFMFDAFVLEIYVMLLNLNGW
ncbi:hypothetical protein QYF36_013839 [Acer negundo]|nr:hypothetical protein QYF36_013839 [Acer negundo]